VRERLWWSSAAHLSQTTTGQQGCWYWLCSLFAAKCLCTWWEIASPAFSGPGSKSPKSGAVASRAEPRRQPRLSERQASRMRTCQRRSSKMLLIAPLRPWRSTSRRALLRTSGRNLTRNRIPLGTATQEGTAAAT